LLTNLSHIFQPVIWVFLKLWPVFKYELKPFLKLTLEIRMAILI
jgi:hypothetical protein